MKRSEGRMQFEYLIESCSARHPNLKRADIKTIIWSVFNDIRDALINGNSVMIRDFGTFESITKKARTVTGLREGMVIEVPERNYPKFRPARNLRKLVAG
jgi:nucleoid DNA-binding protein